MASAKKTAASSVNSSKPEVASTETRTVPAIDRAITLDVDPRKPRLAWQGMDRREPAVSVPTQVVEIVRPGKARECQKNGVNGTARAGSFDPVGRPSDDEAEA
jgi:hypothetical protein